MRGSDVRALQADLKALGFHNAVDGAFGKYTFDSVFDFRWDHGMKPSGVAGRAVIDAVRAAVQELRYGVPGDVARINANGTATPPAIAPEVVKQVIAAGNQIIDKPYIYAGGHASWYAPGYDCSGSVSYALHGAGLLSVPMAANFASWGDPGPGRWITVYVNSSHVFAAIAGRAFDTADFGGPDIPGGSGPRWRYNPVGNLGDGSYYAERHPPGL